MKKFYAAAFLSVAMLLTACAKQNTNQNMSNNPVHQNVETIKNDNGLISLKSRNNFNETYSRLKKAIEDKDALTIITELDHAENATGADLKLRPTKLIIFGNPKLGTHLIDENQTVGIDLPQKFLVCENEKSEVFVIYNDPLYLARRHNLDEKREELSKMSDALKDLAEAATQ
ncbi:MAG: DUF302 domain-containing protein [Acidobacteriota bacterium]